MRARNMKITEVIFSFTLLVILKSEGHPRVYRYPRGLQSLLTPSVCGNDLMEDNRFHGTLNLTKPINNRTGQQLVRATGHQYLDISVTFDHYFLTYYGRTEEDTKQYARVVVKTAENIYRHSKVSRKVAQFTFKIIEFVILNEATSKKLRPKSDSAPKYLEAFRTYMIERETPQFDIAVLFSGVDLLHAEEEPKHRTSLLGLAYQPGVTQSKYNGYLIVESKSYRSGVVLAHEIGHSLGVDHDWFYGCKGENRIMAESVHEGPPEFSDCSIDRMQKNMDQNIWETLANEDVKPAAGMDISEMELPGQEMSLEQQCAFASRSLKPKTEIPFHKVCSNLQCSNGIFVVSLGHGLDGTICIGNQNRSGYCCGGICVRNEKIQCPIIVDN